MTSDGQAELDWKKNGHVFEENLCFVSFLLNKIEVIVAPDSSLLKRCKNGEMGLKSSVSVSSRKRMPGNCTHPQSKLSERCLSS